VLYQLVTSDPGVAAAAQATADGLPDKVVSGALGDPDCDPRVLDWLAPRAAADAALFETLVLNPATADQTVGDLAAHAPPSGAHGHGVGG